MNAGSRRMGACRHGQRLPVRSDRKTMHARRHPNLDRPQALGAAPLHVVPHLHARRFAPFACAITQTSSKKVTPPTGPRAADAFADGTDFFLKSLISRSRPVQACPTRESAAAANAIHPSFGAGRRSEPGIQKASAKKLDPGFVLARRPGMTKFNLRK